MGIKTLGNRIPTLNTRKVPNPLKEADDIYSTPPYRQWREDGFKLSGGFCQDPKCKTPYEKKTRLYADHVVELRDGGKPFDPENRLMRCPPCHAIKTARERANRRFK